MNLLWQDSYIQVVDGKKPKKITGTKFASILGKNKYTSEFETWCDIVKVYEFPFIETKYTLAGKIIEPIQADYMKQLGYTVVKPQDVFGESFFCKTHGNFFQDDIFGGMWDYLEGTFEAPHSVFEMKTTGASHRKEWEKDIPEYYALQAALYAYLLGIEDIKMVVSFLTEYDYVVSSQFCPSEENTKIIEFKLHERYPEFEKTHIEPALNWWNEHVVTGISPEATKHDKQLVEAIKKQEESKLNLMESAENTLYEAAKANVVNNAGVITQHVTDNVDESTSQLDVLMTDIQRDILQANNPSVDVIESYYLELCTALYFVAQRVEKLSIYSTTSKAVAKEAYNTAYVNNKLDVNGKARTATDLAAFSENASRYESTVNEEYANSYKVAKAKLDAAQTLCSALARLYDRRVGSSTELKTTKILNG